ncbi:Serine/threonine-protein kinase LMTK1 [Chionoecetes opilio]|uniref:Serine/threonine-protein kinase LMTK1 n=1 Tax=Chionoecetes opilio TaxID=41210 RepID=A0A8J4YB76_CHIOP|nr:Serine/threonine-protein kinase LMTK1 [Chionoecetes opilio]
MGTWVDMVDEGRKLCGDLKAVLRRDRSLSDVTLLRMSLDVASGLTHMHAHHFIHTDLAARNCVVEEDNTVKIGDYGFNLNSYKDEYYCAGDVALPLRWCSPETLKCTDTTIETKEVTKAANVWSFGVVMWEVASRGQMPYHHLDHEQVIQEVIMDQKAQLDPPPHLQLHATKLYNIMRQCWERGEGRPTMAHTHSLLAHLWEHTAAAQDHDTGALGDFEQRWNQLQQQDCRDHSIMYTGNTANLRFESDFSLSALGRQPLGEALSPSLQDLHGSAEDLQQRMQAKYGSTLPSWLGLEAGQQMDSLTQEITDAILKLDDYLAGEKSEPSTGQTSPEKGVSFKVGKDSFVSNPPDSIGARIGGLSMEEGRGHPSLGGGLSEDEEGFSMKLEQGAFTEMVRLKSQSVQDFMKLTVVDDASDSDPASQRTSLGFEPLTQDKTFSSEGNIKEALRDVRFMGELERLQAEHRYSIITEASRECASSIEYRNQGFNVDALREEEAQGGEGVPGSARDSLLGGECEGDSHDGRDSEQDPFLYRTISSGAAEETVTKVCDSREGKSDPSDEAESSVGGKPLPASPDCVVSSRDPKPASLPDIVVHNGGANIARASPSPPPSPSTLTHINSTSDQEVKHRLVFSAGGRDDENTSDAIEYEDNDKLPSVKESSVKSVPSYTPEEIVKGEEIVIGASEDHSLDLYKAVRSTEVPVISPSLDAPPMEPHRRQDKVETTPANVTSSDISDFVSPVFHSAREDVSDTLAGTEGSLLEFEPDSHHKDETSIVSTHPTTLPDITQKLNLTSPLSQHSGQSDELYHTAGSVFTSPEDSNPAKTTPALNTTYTSDIPMSGEQVEPAVMDESLSPNTSWGDLDTSTHFSYRKEAPVDASFEQPEPGTTNTDLKLDLLLGEALSPSGKKATPEAVDIMDPVLHAKDGVYSVNTEIFKQEKCIESLPASSDGGIVCQGSSVLKCDGAVNGVESGLRGVPGALQIAAPGSAPYTTMIIKGEDDLSPSAYHGSWSAEGDGGPGSDELLENGDFWEQQMVAWQAAAFQTRQLLQEASGQEAEGGGEAHAGTREEEASPRSDASSSPKSLYSSTDLLNLDGEGTYVSYNTTDEEEVLGYRPEDISALRAELCLKLDTGRGRRSSRSPANPRTPPPWTVTT